jgi:hypothetical protein
MLVFLLLWTISSQLPPFLLLFFFSFYILSSIPYCFLVFVCLSKYEEWKWNDIRMWTEWIILSVNWKWERKRSVSKSSIYPTNISTSFFWYFSFSISLSFSVFFSYSFILFNNFVENRKNIDDEDSSNYCWKLGGSKVYGWSEEDSRNDGGQLRLESGRLWNSLVKICDETKNKNIFIELSILTWKSAGW